MSNETIVENSPLTRKIDKIYAILSRNKDGEGIMSFGFKDKEKMRPCVTAKKEHLEIMKFIISEDLSELAKYGNEILVVEFTGKKIMEKLL